MNGKTKFAWLSICVVLASLLLKVAVSADGGNPPSWWDNPDGHSTWREAKTTAEPTVVNAYSLTVSIEVPNTPNPEAFKEVWMQVEWGSDDEGVVASNTEFPTIQWSYVGCEGPWEPADPQPMEPAGDYVPELPSEYEFGREYATIIEPKPACERITVTFVDNTPTTPDNQFTIWYDIEVQTLCFDSATAVNVVRLLVMSWWTYAITIFLIVMGLILIWWRRRYVG